MIGGKLLPSGSTRNLSRPDWAIPSKHLPFPIEIPVGTLVRVLPIAGPIWSGITCVVVSEAFLCSKNSSAHPSYKVTNGSMETILPKYALDVISFPPGYEPSW